MNDSSNVKTKWIILILIAIVLVVVGFYAFNFQGGLSVENGDWGSFGDYVGGILNPVIAAFAFYLIAKVTNYKKQSWKQLESF